MTVWDGVLVALDARAEGREDVAEKMFGDGGVAEIDVMHVRKTHSKQPPRPKSRRFDYDYEDDQGVFRPLTPEESADERRRCRLVIETTPWMLWTNRPLSVSTLSTIEAIYKRHYSDARIAGLVSGVALREFATFKKEKP